jgi:hypothetical protein
MTRPLLRLKMSRKLSFLHVAAIGHFFMTTATFKNVLRLCHDDGHFQRSVKALGSFSEPLYDTILIGYGPKMMHQVFQIK